MDITQFDITQSAQLYSQIAGILAGFSFAVLILFIQQPEIVDEKSQTFLLMSFVGNMIVALLWALASGETEHNTNRPSILSYFATQDFLFSTLMTILLMILVTSLKTKNNVSLLCMIFLVCVFISCFYLFITSLDLLIIQRVNAILEIAKDRIGTINTMRKENFANNFVNSNKFFVTVELLILIIPISIGALLNFYIEPGKITARVFVVFVILWLAKILLSTILYGIFALSPTNAVLSMDWILFLNLIWAMLLGYSLIFLPLKE